MNKFLAFCIVTILFMSCESEPQNKYLTYQNIVILSDMSSRLENKPSKDMKEIHKIVKFFHDECVKPGEKIGDKSSISFAALSGKDIFTIDIGKIKNLGLKQQFVNSTGIYEKRGLTYQINEFERKIDSAYKSTKDEGLDLISILLEKIENQTIVKKNLFLTNGIDTTFVKYDTHIYIFTDGYLEYKNKVSNAQFYFGDYEIKKIRQLCKSTNTEIENALNMNPTLRLPIYKSDRNQLINLHVYETHERDKSDRLQTYRNPKGLRDNEILEAVWSRWAEDSGFKSFEWKKY